jgi:hypothetical protein
MSDGELIKLALESSTLSDTAWDALEDELDRRHLEVPEPEVLPQISIPEMRDLVVLRHLLGGVKLLVQPGDFSKASRILNEPISDSFEPESESNEA